MADPSGMMSDIDTALSAPPPASDSAPTQAAAPPILSDIDNALAGAKPPPEPKAKPSALANLAAGADTGLIAGSLGAPVDLATAGVNVIPHALGYKGIQSPVAGSEWWNNLLAQVGVGTASIPPQDKAAEVEQSIGQGIGGMLGPNMAAKAKALTGIVGPAAKGVEDMLASGSVPANAAIGALSGVGGEAGAAVAPPGYENLGYEVGSLGVGIPAGFGVAAADAIGRGAGHLYDTIPPLQASTREAVASQGAADRLRASAADPAAAMENVGTALDTGRHELIPGSLGTTADLSGDVGLLGTQRAQERKSTNLGDVMLERRGQAATARSDALETMAPSLASPEDTQNYLKQFLANSDAATDQVIQTHQQNAGHALQGASPQMLPEEQGALARGAVEAERAPQASALVEAEQGATSNLAAATGQFGGQEALGSVEQRAAAPAAYGAAMRDPIADAYAAEKSRLQTMRNAIDPNGTMGMQPTAAKAAVGQIKDMFTPASGAQFSGPEQNLYNTVSGWGNLIPVDQAFQMRANINGRLRQTLDHSPQESLRLGMLKRGIDQSIGDAVNDIGVGEQAGVIHQGLPPIADRLSGDLNQEGVGANFQADVARAYAASPTARRAAARSPDVRSLVNQGISGDEPVRPGGSAGPAGPSGESAIGPGGASGAEGVPQEPLTPLTADARNKFSEWNTGYRQMGQTFRGETPGKLHAVGKILQKGGAYDSYKLTDAEVPWMFANSGKTSRDAIDRFLAAGGPPKAIDDALSFSLRRAAQNDDRTLNLPEYDKWFSSHGAAVSVRPELLNKFGTAARAQRRLDDIQTAIAEHAKANPLKPGWSDSSILPRFFKPGPEGAERMAEYQRITGNRPEAQKAAIDHAAFSFAQAAVRDGAVVPRLADGWLRQHDGALSAVPGLKDKFANATEAQKTVENAISEHETARDEFTKSVAGAFMQDDPEKAISRVFTGANRSQKAKLLMDLTKGNKAAQEGLQRAAIDHIKAKLAGAAVPGSEAGALGPVRFGKFVDENRQVLGTLFPGRLPNFDAIAADLKRSALVPNAKMPGGSDTAELRSKMGHDEHGNNLGTAATMLLAEHAGEHVGRGVGHVFGHALGALMAPAAAVGSLAGKMVLGNAKTALKLRTDSLFDRILLDPHFAMDMNRAYPKKPASTRPSIRATLHGRMVQQAIFAARGNGLADSWSAP